MEKTRGILASSLPLGDPFEMYSRAMSRAASNSSTRLQSFVRDQAGCNSICLMSELQCNRQSGNAYLDIEL